MSKKTPNPNGKKGGEKHQNKIKELFESFSIKNLSPELEYYVPTPNGKKRGRFLDIIARNTEDDIVKAVQVGKTNKNGQPVKREREAIEDIEKQTNLKIDFEDYQKQ